MRAQPRTITRMRLLPEEMVRCFTASSCESHSAELRGTLVSQDSWFTVTGMELSELEV